MFVIVYVCLYWCMYLCIGVCIFVLVYVSLYWCMYLCIGVCIFVMVYVSLYWCMYLLALRTLCFQIENGEIQRPDKFLTNACVSGFVQVQQGRRDKTILYRQK